MAVRSQAEVPSGCFTWGCEVLEDKSLRVDQASAEPLVSVVPWFVDADVCVRTTGTSRRMSACLPTEYFPSISGRHLVERAPRFFKSHLTEFPWLFGAHKTKEDVHGVHRSRQSQMQ